MGYLRVVLEANGQRKVPDVTQYTQVLSAKDGRVQVTNRVFAPNLGIDEDPVVSCPAVACN